MEKKVYELKIDEEFARLIPPLADDERERLENSIKKEGCTDPLTVWKGTLIDGHNRYSICTGLEIPFEYVERNDFKDRNAVKAWIIEHQLGRRNLKPYHKAHLALEFESLISAEARERQGTRNDLKNFPHNCAESYKENETREKIAKIGGISRGTISRVKKIDTVADDEMKQKLESGEMSVNKAYTTLFGKEAPDTVKVTGKKAVHVEGKMPDNPESFSVVENLLEDVAKNYLVSLEHILHQYTPGMVTEENNAAIMSMFRGTNQEALGIIRKRLEEVAG